MLFARSKQLKAVGKTTFIPVCFAVNEPLLFATPIVLNPYFFVPFLLAPMVNVSLFKFFVDVLKMNSFIYVLPWATPAPIGLILGTGISFLAVLLAVFFKGQIMDLLTNLFGTITEKANSAVSGE